MNNNTNSPEKRKTIMVVDDDLACHKIVQVYFEKDYDIISMNDGQEALVYLNKIKVPDLILLDMQMPNMDGRLFLRRIRRGDPNLRDIPIIFISSVSSEMFIKSVVDLGVIDYVVKPLKREDLMDKVHELLKWKTLQLSHHQIKMLW